MIDCSQEGKKQDCSRLGNAPCCKGNFRTRIAPVALTKRLLRAIAARKLSLEQVVEWVDHIGFCSPCYVEYDALRRQAVNRRWMQFGAIAAGIAIVVGLGIWAWFGGWGQHLARRRSGGLGRTKSAVSISETGLSYVAEESKAPSHRLRPWS